MVVYKEQCKVTQCEPGVTRRVLAYSEEMMMCEITFEIGARGTVHSHIHEQITYVAEGSFVFTIDGETKVLNQGDSVCIRPNSIHGVECRKAGTLVDVFHPMRKDFL